MTHSPTNSSHPGAEVQLFTDGACSGNPGPGGWAFILRHVATGHEKKQSGAEPNTTNNRMELRAAIQGLASLQRACRVELVTDSAYVAQGLSQWLPKWKAMGWRRGKKRSDVVKNEDLWRQLDELALRHQLQFTQVRGHSGHPENEQCDRMAVAAYEQLIASSAE